MTPVKPKRDAAERVYRALFLYHASTQQRLGIAYFDKRKIIKAINVALSSPSQKKRKA